MDDWSWLASLREPPSIALWQPHNEHVIVIPRILLWVDYWVWGWPGYASQVAGLLSHVVVVAAFWLVGRDRSHVESWLLLGSALVITCSTYSLQSVVFPAAVNFPMVTAFATMAIGFVALSAADPGRQWRWSTGAIVTTVMAMLCVTNGLVIPFILAILAYLLGRPRSAVAAFLVLGIAGITVRYLLGGMPNSAAVASPMAMVRFALAVLGGPLASVNLAAAVLFGDVVALLSGWIVWRFVHSPVKRPVDAFIARIIVFVVLSAAMTALGRAQFDPSVAAESRYAEIVAVGWVALLYGLLQSGASERRATPRAGMRRPRMMSRITGTGY